RLWCLARRTLMARTSIHLLVVRSSAGEFRAGNETSGSLSVKAGSWLTIVSLACRAGAALQAIINNTHKNGLRCDPAFICTSPQAIGPNRRAVRILASEGCDVNRDDAPGGRMEHRPYAEGTQCATRLQLRDFLILGKHL